MLRQRCKMIALLLGLAVFGQAVASVDHVHVSLVEQQQCESCLLSSSEDAIASSSPIHLVAARNGVPVAPQRAFVTTTSSFYSIRGPPLLIAS